VVVTVRRRVVLLPRTPPLVLAAGTPHATRALADTWLVAERYAAAAARSGTSRKSRRRSASARAASRAR
jgi:hypothetical protein